MAMLFAGTTLLARRYRQERVSRAGRLFQQAEALEAAGRLDQAIDLYRDALTIERGGRPEYRLAIARSLYRANRLPEASAYLQQLLEIDPTSGVGNLLLARIAAAREEPAVAGTYYRRAIYGQWDDNADENRLVAHFEFLELLMKFGNGKAVLSELLDIAGEIPDDPAARKKVAGLLLEYGAPNQSAEVFRTVAQQNRSDAEAYAGLGRAELAQGHYRDARAALSRAVRLDSKNRGYARDLGLVNDIAELDPTVRGLSSTERYRRSRAILERSVADLRQCLSSRKLEQPPENLKAPLEAASKLLESRRRPRQYGDAMDRDISLAERIWAGRGELCSSTTDEALRRVLQHLQE